MAALAVLAELVPQVRQVIMVAQAERVGPLLAVRLLALAAAVAVA